MSRRTRVYGQISQEIGQVSKPKHKEYLKVTKVDWPTPVTTYFLDIPCAVTSQSWGTEGNG